MVFRVALLSGVLMLSGGCFLQKKPTIRIPVTAPPTPTASPAPTPPPTAAPEQTAPAAPLPEPAKPSPFPPVTNTPVRPAPVKPAPAAPTPIAPTPVSPAPALGAIMTPEQRRQLDAAYQADLNQANLVVGRLTGRSMTAEQLDSLNRARAWIRQAAQYHNRDLATAAELARRAKVLTQDLAGALK